MVVLSALWDEACRRNSQKASRNDITRNCFIQPFSVMLFVVLTYYNLQGKTINNQ